MPKIALPPVYAPVAFTVTANHGRLRELITDIKVSEPIFGTSIAENDKRLFKTKALWDTGATNSVITKDTVSKLGILPISKTIASHAGGESTVNVYLINIYLPNKIIIPGVRVTECENKDNFGVIIGMDIITLGDFAVTNLNQNTVFSYRFPSSEVIDFVKHPIPKKEPIIVEKKVGRNDPCTCGSGKKYKNCHGQGL